MCWFLSFCLRSPSLWKKNQKLTAMDKKYWNVVLRLVVVLIKIIRRVHKDTLTMWVLQYIPILLTDIFKDYFGFFGRLSGLKSILVENFHWRLTNLCSVENTKDSSNRCCQILHLISIEHHDMAQRPIQNLIFCIKMDFFYKMKGQQNWKFVIKELLNNWIKNKLVLHTWWF